MFMHMEANHGKFYSHMCGPPRPYQCSVCRRTMETEVSRLRKNDDIFTKNIFKKYVLIFFRNNTNRIDAKRLRVHLNVIVVMSLVIGGK